MLEQLYDCPAVTLAVSSACLTIPVAMNLGDEAFPAPTPSVPDYIIDEVSDPQMPRIEEFQIQAEPVSPIEFSQHEKWSEHLEREFTRLAQQVALGTLPDSMKDKFHVLNEDRLRLKSPRLPDEILAEFEHRSRLFELTSALEKYVRYQKAARSALPAS